MLIFSLLFHTCLSNTFNYSVKTDWGYVNRFENTLFFINDFHPENIVGFLNCSIKSGSVADLDICTNDSIYEQERTYLDSFYNFSYYLPRLKALTSLVQNKKSSEFYDFLVNDGILLENEIIIGELPSKILYCDFSSDKSLRFIADALLSGESFALRPFMYEERSPRYLRGYSIQFQPKEPTIDPLFTERDFGLHFTQYIIDQNRTLPHLLQQISGDWPLHINEIMKNEPGKEANQTIQRLRTLLPTSHSSSIINGRIVGLENIDIYSLLSIVKEEKSFRYILENSFSISSPLIDKITTIQPHGSGSFLLDFRSSYVRFLNNIETDPETQSWSTETRELLSPKSGIPEIRANLLNLVVFVDPTTPQGLSQLVTCIALKGMGIPFRIGLVPSFNTLGSLQRKIGFAFHHIALKSEKYSVIFLLNVFQRCGINKESQTINQLTENHFYESYSAIARHLKLLPWERIYELYDSNTEEYRLFEETQKYIIQNSISLGSALLNGKLISLTTSVDNLAKQIRDMFIMVQESIINQNIADLAGIDVLDLLSDRFIIGKKYDKTIFDSKVFGMDLFSKPYSFQKRFINFLSSLPYIRYSDKPIKENIIVFTSDPDISTITNYLDERLADNLAYIINPTIPPEMKDFFLIAPNVSTLIINGRIFRGFDLHDIERFQLIEAWSRNMLLPFESCFSELSSDSFFLRSYLSFIATDWISNKIMRMEFPENLWLTESQLTYKSESFQDLSWIVFLDPSSNEHQKTIDMICYSIENCLMNVHLIVVPPSAITTTSNIAIQSYFRTNYNGDMISFYINEDRILTTVPCFPHSWVFEPTESTFDLFSMSASSQNNECMYLLIGLVSEGYSISSISTSFNPSSEVYVTDLLDRIVISTRTSIVNGYFQVSTLPGMFMLKNGENVIHNLFVSSFASSNRYIPFSPSYSSQTENNSCINVFSLSKGYENEEYQRIMMASASANSDTHIKFWLYREYVSPKMKLILPILSQKYGFSYELIGYKWPSWLRPQSIHTKKLMAEKILFFDLIFPHSISQLLYIDPKQLIRADLSSLLTIDIGNAPYAFVPYSDTNPEMESHMFWKKGSWGKFLGSRLKYHSSSLILVDLNKFRMNNIGDLLRIHYQELSTDIKALQNLDQDLPNFLQERIPLYSLPLGWMRCPTWAMNEEILDSNTIHFCHNPEPNRNPYINDEWNEYQENITKTLKRFD